MEISLIMSQIVFFSLQSTADLVGESALAGAAISTGTSLAANAYKRAVNPHTTSERDILEEYRQAKREYRIPHRVMDAVPGLKYTPQGERYVDAKHARDSAVNNRDERISPFNVRKAAMLGLVAGGGYGLYKAARQR